MSETASVWNGYQRLQAAAFVLLGCNTVYYLVATTWTKGLDALAWLALFALFAVETSGHLHARPAPMTAIRGMRLAAAAAVCVALIGYWAEREWLDAVNTALWIAVVVLLEFEVRWPASASRLRQWSTVTAAALYSGLGILVLLWAWRGEWFDAYDAALWLAAFAMIELDVLRFSRKKAIAG